MTNHDKEFGKIVEWLRGKELHFVIPSIGQPYFRKKPPKEAS